MKKIVILFILVFILGNANVEGAVIKGGLSYSYGRAGGCNFSVSNFEFNLEQKLSDKFEIGLGVRKEGTWGFNGYYISVYPVYTIKEGRGYLLKTAAGIEYGVPSTNFDRYAANYRDEELIFQKWIYLVQNISLPGDKVSGKSGTLYPFGAISYSRKWKRLVVEGGLRVNLVKFGIKTANFETGSFKDREQWGPILAPFVRVGIRIF